MVPAGPRCRRVAEPAWSLNRCPAGPHPALPSTSVAAVPEPLHGAREPCLRLPLFPRPWHPGPHVVSGPGSTREVGRALRCPLPSPSVPGPPGPKGRALPTGATSLPGQHPRADSRVPGDEQPSDGGAAGAYTHIPLRLPREGPSWGQGLRAAWEGMWPGWGPGPGPCPGLCGQAAASAVAVLAGWTLRGLRWPSPALRRGLRPARCRSPG